MLPSTIAPALLSWYARHHRDLPWRHTRDPYLIWLSEVILQQTRVAQGLPYYQRFAEAFPTVRHLANADEREVLRLWQGLGYYSRARNMHHTARLVVAQHGGQFPDTYAGLLQLRGIGPYTAAAIASFAFGERVAVLDGNVFRVLARVFGETTDIASSGAKKTFGALANAQLPVDQADTYNQAIMEFGAVQCTPARPNCLFCPLASVCVANLTGQQATLPVKRKKAAGRERWFTYFVLQHRDALYLNERRGKDIWAGLYDFYLVETEAAPSIEALGNHAAGKPLLAAGTLTHVSDWHTHVLTHQRVRARFLHLRLPEDAQPPLPDRELPGSFFSLSDVQQLPKPILIDKYLRANFF